MAILVMCVNSSCGELFDAREDSAGRVCCPACGTWQPLPGLPGARSAATVAAPPSPPPAPPVQPARPSAGADGDLLTPAEPLSAYAAQVPSVPSPSIAHVEKAAAVAKAVVKADEAADETYGIAELDDHASSAAGRRAVAQPIDAHADVPEPGEEVQGDGGVKRDDAPGLTVGSAPVDEWFAEHGVAQAQGDGALEHPGAGRWVWALGSTSLLAGAVLGWLGTSSWWGLYAGVAVGWGAGFVLAMLVLLNVDPETAHGRCPRCRGGMEHDADQCSCGWSAEATRLNPLTADCLQAIRYAVSRPRVVLWLAVVGLVLGVVGLAARIALSDPAMSGWTQGAILAVGGLIAATLLGHICTFLVTVAGASMVRRDQLPFVSSLCAGRNFVFLARMAMIVVAYVVLILPLPLLPVGVVAVATRESPLRLRWALRIARKSGKDFLILWLCLLLWMGVLSVILATLFALDWLAASHLPAGDWGAICDGARQVLVPAVGFGIGGAVVCAMFRCIGLYGWYNEETVGPHRGLVLPDRVTKGAEPAAPSDIWAPPVEQADPRTEPDSAANQDR